MHSWEIVKHILRGMRAHKSRSALALLGITWGTLSVILLLALGQGFYTINKKNISSIVNGNVILYSGVTSKPYRGSPKGRVINITPAEVMTIAKVVPGINAISPVVLGRSGSSLVHYQDRQVVGNLKAVAASYQLIKEFKLQHNGRFLSPLDIQQHSRVVVIGSAVKKALFSRQLGVIGQSILIQGAPFLVVGMIKENSALNWENRVVYIPYTTEMDMTASRYVSYFIIKPNNVNQNADLQQHVRRYLASRYHFSPSDTQAVRGYDSYQAAQFFHWFFRSIQAFLGFCGAMTLGVGGIGVVNILFLIVQERTREIGLRMALGARDRHIMSQVMLESALIVLLGGLAGFLVSWAIVFALSFMTLPTWLGQPSMSWGVVFITIGILFVLALLAGYFPARRAVRLSPVQALEG